MRLVKIAIVPVLLVMFIASFAEGAVQLANREWVLKPGVNCKVEDYRSVFGMNNIRSFGTSFDSSWTDKEGSANVSANTSGVLSSSGSTYSFAPSHGWAGVVKNYTPDITTPMDVGLEAIYKVTSHAVEALPSTSGDGGGYARAMFYLRVTDQEDNKVYTKWVLNYGGIACAFVVGETQDKDDKPLTFTLKPGHHYKLEAFIETKAAAFADPNSTSVGSATARMSVAIQDLRVVPKNPPWVSVWSMEFVPKTYDTYDRYERILKKEGKAYFPARFKFTISAGGDYAAADSYVRLDCRGSKVVKVTGDLPGASAQTSQVSYMIPAGGGMWSSSVLIDTEVDPNKAPLTSLPAPMVQYFMTMDGVKTETHKNPTIEYDPSNWGILIGNKAVMYDEWGTGAILQAIREQNSSSRPQLALNTQNLCFKNPVTGEVTPVDQMIPSGVTIKPPLKLSSNPPTDKEIQIALKNNRNIYTETQAIGVYARAANGADFVSNTKQDLKYIAVFDFLPRPQPIILEPR